VTGVTANEVEGGDAERRGAGGNQRKTERRVGRGLSEAIEETAMAKRVTKKKVVKKKTGAKRKGADGGLKDFCRSLPGTTEDIKWGDDLIFSVGGKMYAGFDVEEEEEFAFKSEEEEFMGLIQREGIIPAPYMAKHFWVKVSDRKVLKDAEWERLLRKAHGLVVEKLPARTQREIMGEG
jgi:predicted DNA-binding protein (MmcQ/YjbR family)